MHLIFRAKMSNYPLTKWEGYSFGFARLSVTISQHLLVIFVVKIISTMNSPYPTSFVKIDSLILELLPLYRLITGRHCPCSRHLK